MSENYSWEGLANEKKNVKVLVSMLKNEYGNAEDYRKREMERIANGMYNKSAYFYRFGNPDQKEYSRFFCESLKKLGPEKYGLSFIEGEPYISSLWEGLETETRKAEKIIEEYIKAGKDLQRQSLFTDDLSRISDKACSCGASSSRDKVKYYFFVRSEWEENQFPGHEKIAEVFDLERYTKHYKAIESGINDENLFNIYFGSALENASRLESKYPKEIRKIKKHMVSCIRTGLGREQAKKVMNRIIKKSFYRILDGNGKRARYDSVKREVDEAFDSSPFTNPYVYLTLREEIGCEQLLNEMYSPLTPRQKKRLNKSRESIVKRLDAAGKKAKKGKSGLRIAYECLLNFYTREDKVENTFRKIRKKYIDNIGKSPVANIEMKRINRISIGLEDYVKMKSQPGSLRKAKRVLRKAESNRFVNFETQRKTFNIFLRHNRGKEAIRLKNSLKKDGTADLSADMEKGLSIYRKYEKLFS